MKAACLITFAFACLISYTFSYKSNKLYNVLTGKSKIGPIFQSRFREEVDEHYDKLRRRNIDGMELVNLVKDILEGMATQERIEGCQLVQMAKSLVLRKFAQDFGKGSVLKKIVKGAALSELFEPSTYKELRKLTDTLRDVATGLKEAAICKPCVLSLNLILVARRILKLDKETIIHMFHLLCSTLGKSLIGEKSCLGLVNINMDAILYIADNGAELGSEMCGILLQNYGCKNKGFKDWNIKIDNGSPFDSKKYRNQKLSPYKVLHISDIHYDPYYAQNVSTNCNEVMLCCQEHDEQTENEEDKSGFWTDYRSCDVPAHFIDEAFKTIKDDQKHIKYIYFTGDVISHRAWNIDTSTNIQDLRLVMDMFKKYFPSAKIFPILGNHESHPINLFTPDDLQSSQFSMQQFFNSVADLWKHFLPDGTDLETIRKGGFYTVKEIDQPRIIALNSNVGYILNFWLIHEEYDYYNQLQWLADTLHEAETAGETVHILSHIPSGSGDAYVVWSRQFQKIIERYYHIIAGIFSGHTHIDELYVYYKNEKPINMGFNGGSITPYVNVNPNYKMLTVASDTYDILDIEEYYVNVTDANLKKSVQWHKLYSFKDVYNLNEINPANLNGLVMEMATNSSLRNIYRRNSYRLGPAINDKCDRYCHLQNLCKIVTNVYGDQIMCNKLKNFYRN